MRFGRQFVVFFASTVLLASIACIKNKPQLPLEAKTPAEVIATPLPPEISEETLPPAPTTPQHQEVSTIEEPRPQPAKHRKRKTSQSASPAQNSAATPPPTAPSNNAMAVAHPPSSPVNEAPPDAAIGADVNRAELSQQKQNTAQLLDSTEKTLSGLGRNLSPDEEQMVSQIRSYVSQSRRATTDGDFERAYNLATKAHLLSDALIKK